MNKGIFALIAVIVAMLLSPAVAFAEEERTTPGEKGPPMQETNADQGMDVDIGIIGDNSDVDVNVDGDNNDVNVNGRNVNDPVAIHNHINKSDNSDAYRRLKSRLESVEALFGQWAETLDLTVRATAKTIEDLAATKEQAAERADSLQESFNTKVGTIEHEMAEADASLSDTLKQQQDRITALQETTDALAERDEQLSSWLLLAGCIIITLAIAVIYLLTALANERA